MRISSSITGPTAASGASLPTVPAVQEELGQLLWSPVRTGSARAARDQPPQQEQHQGVQAPQVSQDQLPQLAGGLRPGICEYRRRRWMERGAGEGGTKKRAGPMGNWCFRFVCWEGGGVNVCVCAWMFANVCECVCACVCEWNACLNVWMDETNWGCHTSEDARVKRE